jgi:hypothetical protein
MALGARRNGIATLVLVSGAKPALIGCTLGVLVSLGVSRIIQALLFEVSANGEHRRCDKKPPTPNRSDIEAFPDFESGEQYPVRSAQARQRQQLWVGERPLPISMG